MSWSSCSSTTAANVVDVAFCRTKCGKLAVIHEDYYFHHNRKYKGYDYWCCAQRGCKVRLISSRMDPASGRMEFSRRNRSSIQHHHSPNAPNLVEKEFRRQLINQMHRVVGNGGSSSNASSIRLVYDQIRAKALEQGVPESLIPSFWNVRSTMYRIRGRTAGPAASQSSLNEGCHPSSGEGAGTGSSNESDGVSSTPPQTEPLALVVRRDQHVPSSPPPAGSFAQLSSSSSSSKSADSIEVVSTSASIVLSSSTANTPSPDLFPQPQTVPSFLLCQPAMMEHYAVLQHALYMRSLLSLGCSYM